jgi:hypothetical protein
MESQGSFPRSEEPTTDPILTKCKYSPQINTFLSDLFEYYPPN